MGEQRPSPPPESGLERDALPGMKKMRERGDRARKITEELILLIPDPDDAGRFSPEVIKTYKKQMAEIIARQIEQRPDCEPAEQEQITQQIIKTFGRQMLRASKSEHELESFKTRTMELERASKRDPLTGLQNRKGAEEGYAAIRELEREGIFQGETVFVRFDLDNFKLVNDLLSHNQGDQVLRWVAKNLETKVNQTANSELTKLGLRPADVRIRFSGDEFGIILTDVRPGKRQTANGEEDISLEDTIKKILVRVVEAIEDINEELPAQVKDKIFISASVGYAIVPKNGATSFDEANARADKAAGTAKLLKFLQREGEDYRSGKKRIINFDVAEKEGLQTQEEFRTLSPSELETLQTIQPFLRALDQAKKVVDEDMVPSLVAQFNQIVKTIQEGIRLKQAEKKG